MVGRRPAVRAVGDPRALGSPSRNGPRPQPGCSASLITPAVCAAVQKRAGAGKAGAFRPSSWAEGTGVFVLPCAHRAVWACCRVIFLGVEAAGSPAHHLGLRELEPLEPPESHQTYNASLCRGYSTWKSRNRYGTVSTCLRHSGCLSRAAPCTKPLPVRVGAAPAAAGAPECRARQSGNLPPPPLLTARTVGS